MLLCIIMCVGSIALGAAIYYIGMFFQVNLAKDIDTKCEDVVSWYNEAAKADVAKFVAEKRGELIRKRILINAFKGNANYNEFARIKSLTPPACICAHLSDSYLNTALSLAA